MNGDPTSEWRVNPHVQSYVMATDQVWCSMLVKIQALHFESTAANCTGHCTLSSGLAVHQALS